MKKRIVTALYIAACFHALGFAQQTKAKHFNFPDDQSPSYATYQARDYIWAKPGTYLSNHNQPNGFYAFLNENLVAPGEYLPTPVDGSTRAINTAYEVGTLPGAVQVSASGAATYAIPIDVLPGKNGLVPGIRVTYSSSSGNGMLGWGWHLSAASAISRGTTTFLREGYIEGNNFTGNDRFYLDGNRLVLASGTYGADGSTYRLQSEDFSKIKLVGTGNTAYFKAWARNGRRRLASSTSAREKSQREKSFCRQ